MNSSYPKVSVVLAAYNEEDNICSAIESIISQTYQSWEMILVDDSSSDSTLELMNEYRKYDNITILSNTKNCGLAKSLNYGISKSSGMYIARMDADDRSFPERLFLQMRFMETNKDVDVLGSSASYIGNDMRIVRMPKTHETIRSHIAKSSPFIHPSVIYKRSFIERLGGYSENSLRAEDYDLWYRGLDSSKYHNLDEPLIEYKEAYKKIIRSTLDCAKVRFKYNPSKSSAIFWSAIQLIHLIKNRYL
jgi:glycosyltransferase involved in cell wall biosynthesis